MGVESVDSLEPRPVSTTPTDAELVARCREGEQAAWDALTARYVDLVYSVARRSGLASAYAGDVVQEVFLALYRNLGRLRRAERLLPWLLKSARRESWRQVRRQRAAKGREQARARAEADPGRLPVEALVELEEEQTVREAYGAIGERCRRLLDALFFSGEKRPYAEIADELDMRVGSIGPTRKRCLEELRVALERLGFGPDAGGKGKRR